MRFFVHDLAAGELDLPPEEAHHFARVLRGKEGDAVELFDGCGRSCPATAIAVGKKSVRVLAGVIDEEPARSPLLTLYVAPPKGDRFRWLVEKATELGVATVQPIETARSVTDPGAGKLDKLRQTSLAACKQCGRNWLMRINPPMTFEAALKQTSQTVFLADQSGSLPPWVPEGQAKLAGFIGPEGGWTDDERGLAHDHRLTPVTLGPHILRTETAAIAIAARLA